MIMKNTLAVQQGVVSQLSKIITTGFKAIRLIYFFTAGEDEVKCWQITRGSKAPQVGFTLRVRVYVMIQGLVFSVRV